MAVTTSGGPSPRFGLVEALQALQAERGYIPRESITELAQAYAVSEADVYGVITFYTDLRLREPNAHILRLCLGESCHAQRCKDILRALISHLGVGLGESTADGRVTLQVAYCLGNCALSPSMMIDNLTYGRLTPEKAVELVKQTTNQ